jgi:hypothetical protein
MCQVAELATLEGLFGEDDLIPEGQSKLLGTERMTLVAMYKGLVGGLYGFYVALRTLRLKWLVINS